MRAGRRKMVRGGYLDPEKVKQARKRRSRGRREARKTLEKEKSVKCVSL